MADRKNPGHIGRFAIAGFPQPLLLPVIPHFVPPNEKVRGPGKQPGCISVHGDWYPVGKWQEGVTVDELKRANDAAANCGLLLGRSSGPHQFLFLDIDTEPNTDPDHKDSLIAAIITRKVIATLAAFFGPGTDRSAPLWVRHTRPGRAGVLLRLPPDQVAGTKTWTVLTRTADNAKLGKLELLATGQQAAVGGVHPFKRGTPILWSRTDKPDEKLPAPRIDDAMPLVASREVVNAALSAVNDMLRQQPGLTVEVKGYTGIHSDEPLPAIDRAPPSVSKVVELFAAMPNPATVERDDYVMIMRCAAGCIKALYELDLLGADGAGLITDAAITWAASWDGVSKDGEVSSEEKEREKWDADFAKDPADRIPCWDELRRHAMHLGNDDLRFALRREDHQRRLREAQDEFEATENAPAMPEIVKAGAPALAPFQAPPREDDSGHIIPRPREAGLVDVAVADIQIADYMMDRFGTIATYIQEEKNWYAFWGRSKGWSIPYAVRYVRTWIEDELVRYTQRYGADWAESARKDIMSVRRIDAIEKLLRTRLGATADSLNRGRGYIQTPEGAFSLATGERLREAAHRDLVDTRLTTIAPAPGPTPEFDALLSHIACHDEDVVRWIWAYLGYVMIGNPIAHVLLVIHGPGGNGKGTLDRIIQHILGTYAKAIDRGVVLESGKNDHKTALYQTRGARYWSVSELQANERWNEAQVRGLTGGDKITARGMGQDMQTFSYEGSFLVTTNFLPSFHRVDDAIARRFRIIHARLKPARSDKLLENRIKTNESQAILARMMAEARIVMKAGYELPDVPAAMKGEASRFFAEQDQFYAWFNTECDVTGASADVPFDDLRGRYDNFLRRLSEGRQNDDTGMGNIDALPNAAFASALRRAGAIVDDASGRRLAKKVDGKTIYMVGGVALRIRLAA